MKLLCTLLKCYTPIDLFSGMYQAIFNRMYDPILRFTNRGSLQPTQVDHIRTRSSASAYVGHCAYHVILFISFAADVACEAFLLHYAGQWDTFTTGAASVNIVSYFNRHLVKVCTISYKTKQIAEG